MQAQQHLVCPDSQHTSFHQNPILSLVYFLVDLGIHSGLVKRNARLSATVAIMDMVLPFGVGAGPSHALYKEFTDPKSNLPTSYLLQAWITAFPVLFRILLELKLLDTTIGIVVLSAGVGNDVGTCHSNSLAIVAD
jgi:Kef-type K+ transport system membrane component KefB